MIEVIPFILLLVLLIVGVPIGFTLGLAGIVGIYLVGGAGVTLGLSSIVPYSSTASFVLSAVPMFVLMAEFITRSGMARDLYDLANKWLGHLPGGLGIATIASATLLGAMSGSSTASAAALAGASYKEMNRYQYRPRLSTGTIAAGGTLSIMIPPSIPMIIYGVQTETSIGKLFIAGIVPGIITAIGYAIVVMIWVKRKPDAAPRQLDQVNLRERLRTIGRVWPAFALVTVVIGGMYAGYFTATEAGAFGAFGALVIGFLMRRLSAKDIWPSLYRSGVTMGMLMIIVIGAHFFSYYIALAGISGAIGNYITSSPLGPTLTIIIFILPIYIILGMFMDNIPILLLTLPITFPIITALGFDPIWFGVIVIALAEIGLLTPPVGLNVFILSSATKVPMEEVYRGVVPFIVLNLLVIAVLIAFPGIVLFLPDLVN